MGKKMRPAATNPSPEDDLKTLRDKMLRWMEGLGGKRDASAAAELETAAGAFLDRHRANLPHLLDRLSDGMLGPLQTLGREAFLALLRRWMSDERKVDQLRRLAEATGRQASAPDGERSDARQAVIERLLQSLKAHWPEFVDLDGLHAYLTRAVTNDVRDAGRRNRRRPLADVDAADPIAADPTPPDALAARERDAAARHVVGRLRERIAAETPLFRAMLTLRIEHRWDYAMLADAWPGERGTDALARQARAKWIARSIQEFIAAEVTPPEAGEQA